jgi:hypothetical protein
MPSLQRKNTHPANTTSFEVHATSAGVTCYETFLARDFQATLNGQSVPYFRVNHAFKAVRIPSTGDWIEVRARPVHWRLSWAMAAVES